MLVGLSPPIERESHHTESRRDAISNFPGASASAPTQFPAHERTDRCTNDGCCGAVPAIAHLAADHCASHRATHRCQICICPGASEAVITRSAIIIRCAVITR